jgi:hypothetical protein
MRRVSLVAALAAVLGLATLLASISAAGAGAAIQCGPPGQPCPTLPPPTQGPHIQIAKSANPTSLPAGGGPVTYAYTVTNGGSVPLIGVTVVDNTCAPVHYVSGDANGNGALDLTETWMFTCAVMVTATTTNVAIAHGRDAAGRGTDASATATVTVGCPPTAGPNCPPPTGTLCVVKYNDLNGDGSKGASEPVLAGVTFSLSPPAAPAQTTPATGKVCWTLPAGTYTVTESGPLTTGSWVPTTPTLAPSRAQTATVTANATVLLLFGDHRFLIDHFQCYLVAPTGLKAPFEPIVLKDQFASRTVAATKRIDLCNPVQKGRSTVAISNPSAHLVCYREAAPQTSPPPVGPTVRIRNQLGNDILRVGAPTALCLPSSKALTQEYLPIPTTLGHYECYVVKDLTPRSYPPVVLTDQFGRRVVEVIAPVALCTPVLKAYAGTTSRVLNPVDHLACYATAGGLTQAPAVRVANQFERTPLAVLRATQLCVPSLKRVLTVPAGG